MAAIWLGLGQTAGLLRTVAAFFVLIGVRAVTIVSARAAL